MVSESRWKQNEGKLSGSRPNPAGAMPQTPFLLQKKRPDLFRPGLFLFGGARRNRTDDLLNAIQALSQLSYGPFLFRTGGFGAPSVEAELIDFGRGVQEKNSVTVIFFPTPAGSPQTSSSSSLSR